MKPNQGNSDVKKEKAQFSSRLGMILATIGFAAGVGNLWRFPYIVGTNGGGIFILYYLAIVLIVGLPLLIAEFSIGSAGHANPVGAYRNLAPKSKNWKINGYIHLIAAVLISGYTMPVYAWILYYIFNTAIGTFSGLSAGEIGGAFDSLIVNHGQLYFWGVVNFGLILLVVRKKLTEGIEKAAKFLLPSLAIIMVILIVKGLTLPNAMEGIKFYLTPDPSKFTMDSALAGISQAFFSLGVAMAVSMVFASYMKDEDKEKLVGTAALVTLADTGVAIAAGFMIFPSVFAFGLEPGAGPGLTFVTMPNVFNQMAGGTFWGVLFYIGFYFAAFSSTIAGWEAPIGYFMEEHNFSRKKAVTYSGVLIGTVAALATWSMDIFAKFDYIENNFFLMFGALAMTTFVGWVWGIDNFAEAARLKSPFSKKILGLLIKFVCPIIIIILALQLFGVIK